MSIRFCQALGSVSTNDPRVEAIGRLVARVEGAARRLARGATTAALVGGSAGLLLWWVAAGDRISDPWQGTAASVLVLTLCLVPAGWLLNVRFALHGLLELPGKLGGVAVRRTSSLRADPPVAPGAGLWGAVRSVRGVVRDYGDVVGSWATVAQLVAPSFWLLTVAALAAVPLLVVVAAVAALLA